MAAFSSRDREAFMAHWAKILRDETLLARAILFNGELAGNVGSFTQNNKRLLGYWIGKEFWGKGIASAGVAQFLKIEITRPLHAWVAVSNAGSIRVLEKCGFRVQAKTNSSGPAGEPIDEFLMVLV